MKDTEYKRNILLYQLYAIFNEPLFWGPILITSLQKLAFMSLAEIYLMESVVIGVLVCLEIPMGALADILGRKKTISIGRVFLLGSIYFFATMANPLEAWIGNILWAVGFSMQSGADSAFLYDTLKEAKRENEYKRIEGKAIGLRMFLIAFCSLATGFLADISLRLPLYLSLPFTLVPLVATFFWKEPARVEHYSVQRQLETLKRGATFAFRSRAVRWMLGFAALIGTTSKLWFFTYNPYFEFVGIAIYQYGVIFFLLNIVAWFFSHYAYKLEALIGERRSVLGLILCVAVPILLMGLVPIWPFAYLVLIQNVSRGFMRPFVGDYVNRHIQSDIRATVLSVQSSSSSLVAIVGMAGFGFLLQRSDLLSALIMLGGLSLIVGIWSYHSYKRSVEKERREMVSATQEN